MKALKVHNKSLQLQKTIFQVSANVNSGTTTSISVFLYTGKAIPSGTKLLIKTGFGQFEVTTSAIIENRATSISIVSPIGL